MGVLERATVGFVGGIVIERAAGRGWIDGVFPQLSTLSVAVCAFALSQLLGGNGFIAAVVAGLSFGQVARAQCPHAADFAEDEGQLLTMLTFMLFGASMAGPALTEASVQVLLYAVLSLTVVRMAGGRVTARHGLSIPTLGFVGCSGHGGWRRSCSRS